MKCALLAIAVTMALQPAFAAGLNPPEAKDAAPEARENVQEKNKDGAEAKCVQPSLARPGERSVQTRDCPPNRR